jgi:NDP-sugar pyrophosphorylase family protein
MQLQDKLIRHALIMAAGRGNRMRPLSDVIPKALAPYKGEALISHSLGMLQKNISNIHVTVGYKSAMLSQYLMNKGGISSIFNTDGHNNSWWIYHTPMRYINEPVLVLTCDNITQLDFNFILSEYVRLSEPACMLVPVAPIDGIDGDYIVTEGDVVLSLSREVPTNSYCSGIQVLNPSKVVNLTNADESFYDLWKQLMHVKELKASSNYPKNWFSVDTLEQLASQDEMRYPGD